MAGRMGDSGMESPDPWDPVNTNIKRAPFDKREKAPFPFIVLCNQVTTIITLWRAISS